MKQLSLILAFFVSYGLFAQNGWKFGTQNKVEVLGKYKYAENLIKANRYEEARANIYWLISKTPNLHKNLYIYGTKMYIALEKEEKDQVKRKEYQDSVLTLYDKRIEYFGEEAKVLNYKSLKSYYYSYKDPNAQDQLYTQLKKTLELNKNKTFDANVLNYFKVVQRLKKKEKLTDDEVLAIYEQVIGILDAQIIAKPKKVDLLTSKKEEIEEILSKIVVVDCDFIQNNLGPKYTATPELKLAKRIYALAISNSCISTDLFEKVSYFILEKEPTAAGYKQLGNIQYVKQKNYSKALESYAKALELTEATNVEEKGDLLVSMAKVSVNQGNKIKARDYAKQSIALGQKTSECYSLIGNLYLKSFNECVVNGDPVKSRSVYIAAYEMFKKAGDVNKMNAAKSQFPSMEDLFNQNKNVGEQINTGCWVNETVTLDKRPKQ